MPNPYSITDNRYSEYENRIPLTGDETGSTDPNGVDLNPKQNMIQKLYPNGVNVKDIYDLGRLGLGISGAVEHVPSWQRPANWNPYLQTMQRSSTQGFSPEEYSLAHQNATNAYASDVNNIANLSGGNAGTALGNLGRATSNLYHNNAELAARDAELRRENLARYGGALTQDVGYGRKIYEDNLEKILRNKQSGAALANDAIANMSGHAQYNQQYGTGSTYQKYLQSLIDKQNIENKLASVPFYAGGDPNTKTVDKSVVDTTAGELPYMPSSNSGNAYSNYKAPDYPTPLLPKVNPYFPNL